MSSILGIFLLFALIGLFAVMIIIQVLLSKMKSGVPGLILPAIALTLGFITTLSSLASMILFPLIVFILPAVVFIVIYIVIRRTRKTPASDELRHMRAQDL
jgi:hypothetical protein